MAHLNYLSSVGFGLLLTTPLLELHLSHVHDGGGDLVHVLHLCFAEAQNVKSVLKCQSYESKKLHGFVWKTWRFYLFYLIFIVFFSIVITLICK